MRSIWLFFAAFAVLLGLSSGRAAQAQTTAPRPTVLADTILSQRTASGVRYTVRQRGTGAQAQAGDRMLVHYTGFLPDGHIFDSSVSQGRPLRLRVGKGEVIPGWDEILLLLPAGSRARVWIPAALAYGAQGVRNPDDDSQFTIPPNTNLVFELEVVKVH
ncbi:FKBP-type peptidyl-prolyl cis-trans isomerase [Hymenobacter cellulosivorans]|uniref:Peptidyl-prolyl cis-trans isomerase n=1 Tax=Hymenobacter cellulosivorans TaxID=2932249 RepID=A0ABY4FFG1_9BACT|nr:FKBP-type peptidyl-prolyl cis-trans isomerase [Hymenobacter cellulosivorans]UOQ54689.1 FKBP-type peptidyl-prolyl cis-trans isomerase [Hymenobacter cellulosivorans]